MGEKVKRQHYVPRMYIERFTSPDKRLCVWMPKEQKILVNQNPEKYAVIGYFYDASKEELEQALQEMFRVRQEYAPYINTSDEQLIEKFLSRSESDAAVIIEQICTDHDALYIRSNMQKMIIFLHDLAYRSEVFRDCVVPTGNSRFDEILLSDNFGKTLQNYQLAGISPLLKTAYLLVTEYNWYVGTVDGAMKLLVSDNPAQGIIYEKDDICIPLSGDTAIIFRRKQPKAPLDSKDMPINNEIALSERSVFIYNAYQLSYANRYMFGDEKSLSYLQRMNDGNHTTFAAHIKE